MDDVLHTLKGPLRDVVALKSAGVKSWKWGKQTLDRLVYARNQVWACMCLILPRTRKSGQVGLISAQHTCMDTQAPCS